MSTKLPIGHRFSTRSIDEARQHVAKSYAPVEVHPLSHDFEVSVCSAAGQGVLAVNTVNPTGSRLLHREYEGGYVLSFALQGSVEMTTAHSQFLIDRRTATLTDSRDHRSSLFERGTETLFLFVESEAIEEAVWTHGGRQVHGRVQFEPRLPMSGSTALILRAMTEALLAATRGQNSTNVNPLVWQHLREAILCALVTAVPHSQSDAILKPSAAKVLPRHVRRAMDCIHSRAQEPLSLSDIAAVAATTPRSLQEGFQRFLGTTPTAYLRNARLERVRADLLDPSKPDSVSAVALAWGFGHMGVFSARYRQMFGELPSETLRRRP